MEKPCVVVSPPSPIVYRGAYKYPPNTSHYMLMANIFPFHTVPPAQFPEPESSPEYNTMLSCTPQLITAIAQDPLTICDEMIAAGLIQSVYIREFIRHPTNTDRAKATKLVDFMTDRVKTSPSDFDKFIAILKRLSWTEDIVGILQKKLIKERKLVNYV